MRIVIDIGVRTVKQEQIYLGSKTSMIHNPELAVILNVWDRDSTTKQKTKLQTRATQTNHVYLLQKNQTA